MIANVDLGKETGEGLHVSNQGGRAARPGRAAWEGEAEADRDLGVGEGDCSVRGKEYAGIASSAAVALAEASGWRHLTEWGRPTCQASYPMGWVQVVHMVAHAWSLKAAAAGDGPPSGWHAVWTETSDGGGNRLLEVVCVRDGLRVEGGGGGGLGQGGETMARWYLGKGHSVGSSWGTAAEQAHHSLIAI
jgi:hypothetical protein